ncbi:MAG: hypothetical protein KDI37_02495 [Xanthomonadales bacterium]|nr:hypothetical protein [Xanthomonadales bacterium]MCB1633461.1 hypothetical protein [Xanthomonadales bacterium]MCB1640573.1 hypothetical protein [Xanthomonadales bacterium]
MTSEPQSEQATRALLVADGGLRHAHHPRQGIDFVQSLDELMSLVEVLCPSWPERTSSLARGSFLL